MAANPTGLSDAMATTRMGTPGASTGTPVYGGTYPMPGTGGPGNYNFGNATNPNPPGTSPFAPTTSMTPGASTGAAQPFNPATPQDYTHDLGKKLNDTFGSGMGALILQFLTKGQGGYNEALTKQASEAAIAGMQTNIERGYGSLVTDLGESGISPASSTAALEKGFYESDVVSKENAITAQMYYDMWNQSMGREYGLLGEAAGATATHQGKAGDWAQQFAAVGQGIGSMFSGQATFTL